MEKRPRGLNPTQGPTSKLGMLKAREMVFSKESAQYQMVSPKNMQPSSTVQTEWVIFLHTCVCVHAYTQTHTHIWRKARRNA